MRRYCATIAGAEIIGRRETSAKKFDAGLCCLRNSLGQCKFTSGQRVPAHCNPIRESGVERLLRVIPRRVTFVEQASRSPHRQTNRSAHIANEQEKHGTHRNSLRALYCTTFHSWRPAMESVGLSRSILLNRNALPGASGDLPLAELFSATQFRPRHYRLLRLLCFFFREPGAWAHARIQPPKSHIHLAPSKKLRYAHLGLATSLDCWHKAGMITTKVNSIYFL